MRVPTWCVESCLKLSVEEVPDDGPVVLILGQPASTGKSHALSKRGSVHFHPVYKPAWGLAWRWERGGGEREGGEGESPLRTCTIWLPVGELRNSQHPSFFDVVTQNPSVL